MRSKKDGLSYRLMYARSITVMLQLVHRAGQQLECPACRSSPSLLLVGCLFILKPVKEPIKAGGPSIACTDRDWNVLRDLLK